MKQILTKVIIGLMIFGAIAPGYASAYENTETTYDFAAQEIEQNLEAILDNELGLDDSDKLEVDAVVLEEGNILIDTELEIDDVSVSTSLEIHDETGEITVNGQVADENNNILEQNFSVFIQEVNGDDFVATFIDHETGEEYEYDTMKAQASFLPIPIIALIARIGISQVIKTMGKKAIQGTISGYTKHGLAQAIGRDGGRGVASWAIKDAVKNPTKIKGQANGATRFENSNAVVVLNKAGKVITTWAKKSSARRG